MSATLAERLATGAWRRVAEGLRTVGETIALGAEACAYAVVDVVTGRFDWAQAADQAWFMARVSLLPTILVAIPFGVVTSIQVGAVANSIGASSFSGAVNGVGVLRQAAPLVTSLIIACVVGSAICSDLGMRAIRDEIAALEVMGTNPIRRMVAPRIVAAVFLSVMLTAIVAVAAIATGYVMNVGRGVVGAGTYLDAFTNFSQSADLWLAEGKAVLFGLIGTTVAAHKGLGATGGPQGVADAVNQTVVLNVIVLAVVNAVLTQGYLALSPGGGA
ncbi:ABC transporter permease [Nocardioides sp. KC13]|uniref:ABC transporter permease n=1 Tax=Nocardioides turkmenicus TaxID=2711220 RepID=A0A6M1RD80_9ACTN|nr:ABC transporter permease [Nocardioides sp. KC13]